MVSVFCSTELHSKATEIERMFLRVYMGNNEVVAHPFIENYSLYHSLT